jgi:bacterioferritin-associated ferredoxin
MQKTFLFAKDIQRVVDQGQRKIEVPEGARFSPSALDLIRDYRVEVVTVGQSKPEVKPHPAPAGDVKSEGAKTSEAERDLPEDEGQTVSEEELEEIVTRVIARFEEFRGKRAETSATGEPKPEAKESAGPDDDLIICRCEEITKAEIKDVIRSGIRTLNGIKRITRAGMGLCQGQTCERLVSQIVASELGIPPAEVETTTARAPVRPIPLSVFAKG